MAVSGGFDGVYDLYEGGEFAFVVTDGKKYPVETESGKHKVTTSGMLNTVKIPLADRHVKLG